MQRTIDLAREKKVGILATHPEDSHQELIANLLGFTLIARFPEFYDNHTPAMVWYIKP